MENALKKVFWQFAGFIETIGITGGTAFDFPIHTSLR
jgi:hypothetical protein